jgi:hypothetical protein
MTIQISEQQIQNKHIARIFQNGNSFAIRIPHNIGQCYGIDRPGYALVEGTDKGVIVKRIDEEKLGN